MNPATTGRTYYPALDGLRGLAILLVLLHHYFSKFQIGWAGVDLFFVLSGFLITDILIKDVFSNSDLLRFYVRRILRIMPIYYCVLALFCIFSPLLFSDKGPQSAFQYYNNSQTWFWGFLQNWLFIKKGAPPVPYLSPLWSLAVEWQFYMMWPFILHIARKYKILQPAILILIGISVTTRTWVYIQEPSIVENYYYNTICRMDSLLLGSFLAVRLAKGKTISRNIGIFITFLIVLLLLICGVLYRNLDKNNVLMATVGYTLLGAFFMMVLYEVLKNPARVRTWLKPLNYIGRISYSIYIIHIPIYLIMAAKLPALLQKFSNSGTPIIYIVIATSFITTLIISSASYHFFEMPIMRLKGILDRRLLNQFSGFRCNLLART